MILQGFKLLWESARISQQKLALVLRPFQISSHTDSSYLCQWHVPILCIMLCMPPGASPEVVWNPMISLLQKNISMRLYGRRSRQEHKQDMLSRQSKQLQSLLHWEPGRKKLKKSIKTSEVKKIALAANAGSKFVWQMNWTYCLIVNAKLSYQSKNLKEKSGCTVRLSITGHVNLSDTRATRIG